MFNEDLFFQTAFVFVDSIPESKDKGEKKEQDSSKEADFDTLEEGEVFIVVGDKLYRFSFDEII